MALKPTELPDKADVFLREVDEDFRRDQMTGLWKRFGVPFLVVLGLALIGLAGWLFWKEQQAKTLAEQSDLYATAVKQIEGGDAAGARATLETLSSSGSPGLKALAQLDLAAQSITGGKPADAVAAYQRMAANGDLPQVFRDYAGLRAILMTYDQLEPAKAIEQLKPLAQDGQPWFGTAGELLALSYLETNQPALAKPLFEALAGSEQVPPSTRARARAMVDSLGGPVAPAAPSPAAPAPTPAAAAPAPSQ